MSSARNDLSVAVGAVVSTLLVAVVALALMNVMHLGETVLSNRGEIKAVGVGVYENINLTLQALSINWGVVDPNSQVNQTRYVRNEGNSPEWLSMTTSNWNPTNATLYMALSWDSEGALLLPQKSKEVVFTLVVFSNVTGFTNFSFDITIMGTG